MIYNTLINMPPHCGLFPTKRLHGQNTPTGKSEYLSNHLQTIYISTKVNKCLFTIQITRKKIFKKK